MAAKSQSRLSAKSSKSGGSASSISGKSDSKGNRKKVTLEDDDGDLKESLAFKILTSEQTNELMGLNVVQIQEKLRDVFELGGCIIDLTQAAILDYYTSAVYWGIQQKFTAQQLSGFFTVMHTLLDNVKEKHFNLADSSLEFNKLFSGIGVDEVKSSGLDFFNVDQAKLITQYVYTTFFQNYKLYLYMFTHTQAEEIIGTDLEVEVAKAADVPFPPPLDEGVAEDAYATYIATPPPSPTPQQSDIEEKQADAQRDTPKPSSRVRSPSTRARSPGSRGSSAKSQRRGSAKGSRGASRGSAQKKKVTLQTAEDPDAATELEDKVAQSDIFSQLTADDVREVIESVTQDMLGSLQSEVAAKLRDKESNILQRINKIHKVAE